jgi:hypothetical protein
MSADLGREQNSQSVLESWEAVGGYVRSAMQEVATDLGGEELLEHVTAVLASDSTFIPNPDVLTMLEGHTPGSSKRVMMRSSEIQQETHRLEIAKLKKPSIRKYGKAIIQGFASFNLSGAAPRKR